MVKNRSIFFKWLTLVCAALVLSSCTGQLKNSFRFAQQEEVFSSMTSINTALDMLWVVDNSGSMAIHQQKIRDGFASFATKYMKPTWDIRVAVITTDTFLANPAFNSYLNSYRINPGSTFTSNYLRQITSGGIPGRTTPFVNPSWAPGLVDTNPASSTYGRFPNGLKNNQDRPLWGPNWAKLLPGNHDGPMTTLCYEGNNLFISPSDVARCYIRDDQTGNTGPNRCAYPGATETSASQCVNTLMNDTVHSGKSIISTIPPTGTPADAAWQNLLIRDFLVNLSPGETGQGSERGMASVSQLMADNEAAGSTTKFFRPNSLRVIIFVSDEEDQSMTIPISPPSGFGPQSQYIGSCTRNVDGVNFTVNNCADSSKLIPVTTYKTQYDTFFRNLDGSGTTGDPNYFIVSIVAPTAASVSAIRAINGNQDTIRADRYIALGAAVGNGSLVEDLSDSDYSSMLDAIGLSIVEKKAQFVLARAASAQEDMIIWVKHADGTMDVMPYSVYTVSGNVVTITDTNYLLTLSATDQIIVNYQPKTQP
jgi:hypothetical protein